MRQSKLLPSDIMIDNIVNNLCEIFCPAGMSDSVTIIRFWLYLGIFFTIYKRNVKLK